ncbi:probable protein phosphatase 2C 62 isoform X2 [Nicotiana sylvestris]|uniref:probable protein phosphatase 2C 62 isoform X2 n=1 Tax=Nicotiana sylvestris TaxID=4096 RepID=UPI00388CCE4F
MADPLCKFPDARCMTGSQFFATYFSTQKSFRLVSLHNPTLVRRRRRTKPLHIAFCSTPTSPNLDVIATHEHSDGSLLFRFGDPSELAKEDELEEPLLGVEEVERDSEEEEEEFSVVKVMDGDNEREVIVKNVERKAKGQSVTVAIDAGVSESVVTNNTRSGFVERETGLSDNLVEESTYEIGLISPVGIQDQSVAEVHVENAGLVEEILEKQDDSETSIPPTENGFPSLEVEEEMKGQSTEESFNEILEKKDDSEASIPPPENSFPSLEVEEEMKGQSSEKQSFEEVDDEKSPFVGSPAAMPEYSDPLNAEEIEESEGEGSGQLIENCSDKDHGVDSIGLMENGAASTEVHAVDIDSETAQQIEQISENVDPIMEEPAESVSEEINLGNTETVVEEISPEIHLSMDAEDQSAQVLNLENDDQTELTNFSADAEDQASQNGTFKDSDEANVIVVMPPSPKQEAEPVLDQEVDHNLISESNEGENPLPPEENLPNLSVEAEKEENAENSEVGEISGYEVVEDRSSEVIGSSKEAIPAELILSSGATLLEYPSKALTGGHEAYFVACGKWLGVADGVGSWSLEGSDPGVYAKELMQNGESIVSQCDNDILNDPKQVLNLSVSKTDSPGSSTALIAHFDGKDLHVANVGDSGFIIVRNGSVYRKSSPMLHEFNLPIQIEKGDDPSQLLEEYKIELDEGDVIVTATDALFDNLYDQEIVSIVSKLLAADKRPQEIAEVLATRVHEVGSSASGRSPFADAAQAAGYVGYTGGKRDDVAVIVSVVQKGLERRIWKS